MNKKTILTWTFRGFAIGSLLAAGFLVAQVATNTTFAQIPATSPGGALNLFTDLPQWIAFNSTSSGTRTYVPVGSALKTTFIATVETTSSTSFVSLTTADLVTFSCATTCTADVWYNANQFLASGASAQMTNSVFVDGSQADDGNQSLQAINNNAPIAGVTVWLASGLAAGSHTVEIKHKVSGGAGWFRDRMLKVALTQ